MSPYTDLVTAIKKRRMNRYMRISPVNFKYIIEIPGGLYFRKKGGYYFVKGGLLFRKRGVAISKGGCYLEGGLAF